MTIKTLWEQIQKSSTKIPTRLKIPNTHSATPTQLSTKPTKLPNQNQQ
jgi:hypothetical protein